MIRIICSLVLALTLSLGCSTVPSTPEARLARVARISGVAASVGASSYLASNPQSRPAFEAAHAALTKLEADGNFNPDTFAEVLRGLPIDELKGPEGEIYISLAIVLWEEVKAESVALNTPEWVKPVLTSVRAGLGRALGK